LENTRRRHELHDGRLEINAVADPVVPPGRHVPVIWRVPTVRDEAQPSLSPRRREPHFAEVVCAVNGRSVSFRTTVGGPAAEAVEVAAGGEELPRLQRLYAGRRCGERRGTATQRKRCRHVTSLLSTLNRPARTEEAYSIHS